MLVCVVQQGLPEPALIIQIQYRGDPFVLNVDTIHYRTDKIFDVMQFFFLLASRRQADYPLGPNRKNDVLGILMSRFISAISANIDYICVINNHYSTKKAGGAFEG
jgi:hypothetical protein